MRPHGKTICRTSPVTLLDDTKFQIFQEVLTTSNVDYIRYIILLFRKIML